MKHPKKSFVSVVLAVAMVITCFLSFGTPAAASRYPELDEPYIYYFYDCYPTVSEAWFGEIGNISSEREIRFEGQIVDEDDFFALVSSNYFEGFIPGTMVIIDIKTFQPDFDCLEFLFDYLKNEENCITVLQSTYTSSEIDEAGLFGYVDFYFETSLEQLEVFVEGAVQRQINNGNPLQGTCFLIDQNMADINVFGSASNRDVDVVCERSPFLRLLLEELDSRLPDVPIDNEFLGPYEAIAKKLYEGYNIRVLVHGGNNLYLDIYEHENCSASTVQALQEDVAPSGTRLCAFGFSELTSNFYSFLSAGQQTLGVSNLPVYVFEIAPLSEGSGLALITNMDMGGSDEIERFTNAFYEFLWELDWI